MAELVVAAMAERRRSSMVEELDGPPPRRSRIRRRRSLPPLLGARWRVGPLELTASSSMLFLSPAGGVGAAAGGARRNGRAAATGFGLRRGPSPPPPPSWRPCGRIWAFAAFRADYPPPLPCFPAIALLLHLRRKDLWRDDTSPRRTTAPPRAATALELLRVSHLVAGARAPVAGLLAGIFARAHRIDVVSVACTVGGLRHRGSYPTTSTAAWLSLGVRSPSHERVAWLPFPAWSSRSSRRGSTRAPPVAAGCPASVELGQRRRGGAAAGQAGAAAVERWRQRSVTSRARWPATRRQQAAGDASRWSGGKAAACGDLAGAAAGDAAAAGGWGRVMVIGRWGSILSSSPSCGRPANLTRRRRQREAMAGGHGARPAGGLSACASSAAPPLLPLRRRGAPAAIPPPPLLQWLPPSLSLARAAVAARGPHATVAG